MAAYPGVEPGVYGRRRLAAGQKIGEFTLVSEAGGTNALSWKWLIRCRCGKEQKRLENQLIYSGSISCGCVGKERRKRTSEAARAALIGRTFGWLTVTEIIAPGDGNGGAYARFRASCRCGSSTAKEGTLSNLLRGMVSTCCRPTCSSAESDALRLGVLRQLGAGASHYTAKHRIVARLMAMGLFDGAEWCLTPEGREAIRSGVLPVCTGPGSRRCLALDKAVPRANRRARDVHDRR